MKLTLKQLVESTTRNGDGHSAISKLANNEDIPANTSYWIAKVARKAETELKDYNAARIKLCEKHGTVKEGAKSYDFTPEAFTEFEKEIEVLHATEIDLAGLNPITLEQLGKATIPPAVMMTLDWLFTE